MLKPGLWEFTSQMTGSAEAEKSQAQFQKNMASMSPEQRKKMEEAMAKHGMKMMPGGPGGMSAQMCLTKEMVERDELPAQHGSCKTTRQPRSGNTMKFAFECANPPSSGDGVYTFVSPESVHGENEHEDEHEREARDDGDGWFGQVALHRLRQCQPLQPRRNSVFRERHIMSVSVGFIGVGNMGNPMASNILKNGYRMTVFDLLPARWITSSWRGAEGARSARQVVEHSEVTFTSLPGSPEVEASYLGADGLIVAAASGTVLVDLSSVLPSTRASPRNAAVRAAFSSSKRRSAAA